MNFSNRQESILTLDGTNTQDLVCELPSALTDNLDEKAIAISDMYMNNTNIPVFIPELATAETLAYDAGATSSTLLGNTDLINATDYFVVLRKVDNTEACAAIIQWSQPRKITAPLYKPDENSVFTTTYYHCFDFSSFIDNVALAINDAIDDVTGGTIGVFFVFDSQTNTFNLAIENTIDLSLATGYQLEFSPKLLNLFPFQADQTNYGTSKIKWQLAFTTIGTTQCYVCTAPLYDTIFPFDYVLLNCNLPMIPVEFISNKASSMPLQRKVFFKFRKANAGIEIYNFFEANNNYLFDKLHRFTQNKIADNKLRLTIILRTRKNHNYIEWKLPSNCQLNIDLNIFSL